jgi:hypothetical protein
MPEMTGAAVGEFDPTQMRELALLVDLEARWENLRHAPRGPSGGLTLRDLLANQRAFEAFRVKLSAYNKRYRPAHVPELLLNTPPRLGAWCRAMRDLYRRVEHDADAHCPSHLLEKAHRCADHVGARRDTGRASRPTPATIRAAIEELEALVRWCDDAATA